VVIAIDAGHDGELELKLLDGLGDAASLIEIDRLRTSLGHSAEAAATGAEIPQQHERRGVMVPALADVGAVRGFANRVQVKLARQRLKIVIVLADRRARLQPTRLGSGLARANVDLDEVGRCGHVSALLYRLCRS